VAAAVRQVPCYYHPNHDAKVEPPLRRGVPGTLADREMRYTIAHLAIDLVVSPGSESPALSAASVSFRRSMTRASLTGKHAAGQVLSRQAGIYPSRKRESAGNACGITTVCGPSRLLRTAIAGPSQA
jgi:hypothetical protein